MKTQIKSYSLIFLLSVLSACKVSKDIPAPQAQLPIAFANMAAADTSSIADLPWKSLFTDVTLENLIDSAIVKNYDMQVAVKNMEAAQLLVKQVKWNNVPVIGLNATASTSRPSDNSLNGLSLKSYDIGTNHIEDYATSLNISWEADIWGKIRNQSKSTLAAYLQTNEAKKLIQTNLVANVSRGYYNLLMLNAQLNIAKKNVALNDSTLHIIKLQFDAGQVTSLAIQQAQAQQQAAAELIPQFEQGIALQENALRILAGDLPSKIVLKSTLDEIAPGKNLPAGIPSALINRRPDVKSDELALTIANASVGISKAEMYPALRITATGGVNSFKASNWFNIPASLFGVVQGSVLQPLVQHKQLQTQYKTAVIEREKTVIRFRQSVLNAVGEISDALVKIDKLKQQQVIAVNRVNTLQQATANAGLLFKNGMASYLEVITAQSNVLQSELELASIKRSEWNAISDLYRALGGGWN